MTDQQQKAKDFLRQYLNKKAEAKQLKLLIDEIEADIDGLKAQAITGMPSGNGVGSSIENAVIKLECFRKEYIDALNESIDIRKRIENAIDAVPDEKERNLLKYRHISGMRWETVAKLMNYSRSQIKRIYLMSLTSIVQIKTDRNEPF